MRDSIRLPGMWHGLAALLPESIRTRVFEPLWWDLWRDHCERGGRGAARIGLLLRLSACYSAAVWYAIPRYFIEGGRFTPFGRATGIAVTVVLLLMFLALLPWLTALTDHVLSD